MEDSIKKYIEYSKKVNKYDEKIEKALCELEEIKNTFLSSDNYLNKEKGLKDLFLGFKAWFNYIRLSPDCSIYATIFALEIMMEVVEKNPNLDESLQQLLFSVNTNEFKFDSIKEKDGSKSYEERHIEVFDKESEIALRNDIDNSDEFINVSFLKEVNILYEYKLYFKFLLDKLRSHKDSYDEYEFLRLEGILKTQLYKIGLFINYYEVVNLSENKSL